MSSASRTIRSNRAIYSNDSSFADSRLQRNADKYSRFSSSSSYVKQRRSRIRRKQALISTLITLMALLIAGTVAVYVWMQSLDESLGHGIDRETLGEVLVQPEQPGDPFWMLLVGRDLENGGISRADTIILAYIDPGHKQAALVSIPRDTRVAIPGLWTDKINAAYAYGMLYSGHTGPELLTRTVLEFTGIDVAGYVEIDLDGLVAVVDALGGVVVDVPVSIIGDREAGAVDVYAGEQQLLDGEHAMVFVRSRSKFYALGDYQRQANQRTFLQALAKQVLSADVFTMASTITRVCEMTRSSFTLDDIIQIARGMRGVQETDIYTYSIPCVSQSILVDDMWISFEIPDVEKTRALFAAISTGAFPDPVEWGLTRQGEVPESYKPNFKENMTDIMYEPPAPVVPSEYIVDVRNGYAIQGSATAVSNFLASAGYIQGEIGNTKEPVYVDTVIIYRSDEHRAAAEDIFERLGYESARIVPSLGRYSFKGDILVLVGGDFRPAT